jgi:hypothetical protein
MPSWSFVQDKRKLMCDGSVVKEHAPSWNEPKGVAMILNTLNGPHDPSGPFSRFEKNKDFTRRVI